MIGQRVGDLTSSGRSRPRGTSAVAAVLLITLLWCGAASAGPQQDFAAHYDHGVGLYGKGQYAEAIAEFKEAYALQRVPLVLINIAQAHLRLNQPREALSYCDHYRLEEPHPRPEIQARLDSYVAKARVLIAAEEKQPVAQQPVMLPPQQAPPSAGSLQQPGPPAVLPERVRRHRPAWRIGTGLGALAAGGVLLGLGASALSVGGQCIGSAGCAFRYDTTVPGVGLTVPGGALIITGAVLLALPGPWQQVAR